MQTDNETFRVILLAWCTPNHTVYKNSERTSVCTKTTTATTKPPATPQTWKKLETAKDNNKKPEHKTRSTRVHPQKKKMEGVNKTVEEILDWPAMAPVKEKYHTFLSLPQKQKSKLSVIASILCFFFFFIILIVLLGTIEKEVVRPKTAVVVFMESTPDDLLAMRYILMRPDYHAAAIVISGSGVATSLKPASENVERFLSLMAKEGNKGAANVPVYYGTSFSTSPSQRVSTAASASVSLPSTPLSAAAAYLNNISSVIGAPRDDKSCSMTSRFVENEALYRSDTLYGASAYLPKRQMGIRGYVDRSNTYEFATTEAQIAAQKRRWGQDPRSSEPFFIPLARDVLLPLQKAGVPIRAVCFGPTTDLVTLLRRSYKTDPATSPMPQFPVPRVFNDIVLAGGAFGSSAVGDVDTYVSTLVGSNGPINVHAQSNFFFDAPSAHTLIEGGTVFNDQFAADMAPILTLVTTNAAATAQFSQSSWNTIVDEKASALTAEKPTATGVALKGISNIRRIASAQPPLYTFDLSAPLGLMAAIVLTDPTTTVKSAVVDRVHVNDGNQVAFEGVTGKGTRTTSPTRSVVLGAVPANFWSIAQNFLFNMPNPVGV